PVGPLQVRAVVPVGVGEHAPHHAAQVEQPARTHLHAAGGGDDVIQHVGLVDHHHVVLGQDDAAGRQVQPVQVEVDHDHVRLGGPVPGQLGEAVLAVGAAVGAGAVP